MPAFEVWFRKLYDGRAPEVAFLDVDYEWAGDVQAISVKDVALRVALMKPEESQLEGHRQIRTGDLVKEPEPAGGRYFVFTPAGVWARVQVVEGGLAQTAG